MSVRKRVVVLDHTASLGGAEIALARLLDAISDPRYEVGVVLFSDGPLRQSLEDTGHTVQLSSLGGGVAQRGRWALVGGPRAAVRTTAESARFVRRLSHELALWVPDLVVANSLKSAVLGGVAARLAGLPWVWHLHDRLSSDYLPAPVASGLRALARHSPRQVIANSAETAASLGSIRGDRLRVVYPGLPAGAFAPRTETPPSPVIGIIGRISATKGQQEFLTAAEIIAREYPDVNFRIVGAAMFNDHDYEQEVRLRARQLGIGDRVAFTGWIADTTKDLDQLTVVVHASPVPEPFGQVVVEAMARGVPVIATRAGGVTEILDPDGDSAAPTQGVAVRTPLGQLVNPGDSAGLAAAMRWVLAEPRQAQRLADAAFESAKQRFEITRTAESVIAAWDGALARN
jgi:glycosyltransferase involved in cell wall biosynthesis